MGRSKLFPPLTVIVLYLAGSLSPTGAAITASGNVEPADPSTGTSSTTGDVGR